MLHKGVLDTYTDSNARERRPYEADGLIAAGNRMLLQVLSKKTCLCPRFML